VKVISLITQQTFPLHISTRPFLKDCSYVITAHISSLHNHAVKTGFVATNGSSVAYTAIYWVTLSPVVANKTCSRHLSCAHTYLQYAQLCKKGQRISSQSRLTISFYVCYLEMSSIAVIFIVFVINEGVSTDRWCWDKSEMLEDKPAALLFCLPQIPHKSHINWPWIKSRPLRREAGV
jgi:hypothetical protein